jgi:pimeloyl-ACP methyl ester carboxylesterase
VERLSIERAGARIAVIRWGEVAPGRPCALLLHGTGFVADVWLEVAPALAATHTVYAVDRRGHGRSLLPDASYHFIDFALDLSAVITALELTRLLGVGHSAGATDLLLCAKLLPAHFERIFAMEPTVMIPEAYRAGAMLSPQRMEFLHRASRRRGEYESAQAAFDRFRAAPAFERWTAEALWAYVHHGFDTLPDGRARLLCTPATETAMLGPIFEAMEQVYRGDDRGNPFGWMREIACPVRIATAEGSAAIYGEMAERCAALVPGATRWRFAGVGHCVAQEAPALVIDALAAFCVGR